MHSDDLIKQFIQLRAQRTPLRHIAEQIGVCLNTAWKWSLQYKDQIDFYRAVHLEAIQQRYLKNYNDKLADLAREIEQIDAELKQRDFECVSTEFLLYRKTCLQARLEKLAPDEPLPEPPAPAAASPQQN
jgi:hypothetical protein